MSADIYARSLKIRCILGFANMNGDFNHALVKKCGAIDLAIAVVTGWWAMSVYLRPFALILWMRPLIDASVDVTSPSSIPSPLPLCSIWTAPMLLVSAVAVSKEADPPLSNSIQCLDFDYSPLHCVRKEAKMVVGLVVSVSCDGLHCHG